MDSAFLDSTRLINLSLVPDSFQPPPRGASLKSPSPRDQNQDQNQIQNQSQGQDQTQNQDNKMNGYGGGYQQNPTFGATFYPGGDDFYVPDNVVSPMPQRYDDFHCLFDMKDGHCLRRVMFTR